MSKDENRRKETVAHSRITNRNVVTAYIFAAEIAVGIDGNARTHAATINIHLIDALFDMTGAARMKRRDDKSRFARVIFHHTSVSVRATPRVSVR